MQSLFSHTFLLYSCIKAAKKSDCNSTNPNTNLNGNNTSMYYVLYPNDKYTTHKYPLIATSSSYAKCNNNLKRSYEEVSGPKNEIKVANTSFVYDVLRTSPYNSKRLKLDANEYTSIDNGIINQNLKSNHDSSNSDISVNKICQHEKLHLTSDEQIINHSENDDVSVFDDTKTDDLSVWDSCTPLQNNYINESLRLNTESPCQQFKPRKKYVKSTSPVTIHDTWYKPLSHVQKQYDHNLHTLNNKKNIPSCTITCEPKDEEVSNEEKTETVKTDIQANDEKQPVKDDKPKIKFSFVKDFEFGQLEFQIPKMTDYHKTLNFTETSVMNDSVKKPIPIHKASYQIPFVIDKKTMENQTTPIAPNIDLNQINVDWQIPSLDKKGPNQMVINTIASLKSDIITPQEEQKFDTLLLQNNILQVVYEHKFWQYYVIQKYNIIKHIEIITPINASIIEFCKSRAQMLIIDNTYNAYFLLRSKFIQKLLVMIQDVKRSIELMENKINDFMADINLQSMRLHLEDAAFDDEHNIYSNIIGIIESKKVMVTERHSLTKVYLDYIEVLYNTLVHEKGN